MTWGILGRACLTIYGSKSRTISSDGLATLTVILSPCLSLCGGQAPTLRVILSVAKNLISLRAGSARNLDPSLASSLAPRFAQSLGSG